MNTTLKVKEETKLRLNKQGSKGDSYDTIISRLLDVAEKALRVQAAKAGDKRETS